MECLLAFLEVDFRANCIVIIINLIHSLVLVQCSFFSRDNFFEINCKFSKEPSLGRILLRPTRLGWLSWLGFFTCSIENQPFSVGLVDQLFQHTRNPVELWLKTLTAITIVGSYPLHNHLV